jgi:hypothetical protein
MAMPLNWIIRRANVFDIPKFYALKHVKLQENVGKGIFCHRLKRRLRLNFLDKNLRMRENIAKKGCSDPPFQADREQPRMGC